MTLIERIEAVRASKDTTLDLSNQGIRVLPPQIFELTWLEDLVLDGNMLVEIPDEISNLKNLRRLSVSENDLMVVPETLGELVGLEKLYLGYNSLSEVPDSIGNLVKLVKLNIAGNDDWGVDHFSHALLLRD